MILSVVVLLCFIAPILSAPATIVSGFGVDEILKEAQNQQEKVGMKSVDSSPERPEVGGASVVDSSTDDSHSHEIIKPHESGNTHIPRIGDDGIRMGREHIHDPEHGNDDVIISDDHHKMRKVTTQIFGGSSEGDVEIGGNSENPKPIHHHHHSEHRTFNPEVINGDQQNFKKGWAPTEIVWSPTGMANGYDGGIRRPEYRHAAFFVRSH